MKNQYWFGVYVFSILVFSFVFISGCGMAPTSDGGGGSSASSIPSVYFQSAHSPYKIYKMGSDGTSIITIEISTFAGSMEQPALSPEKDKLAFVSWEGAVSQVWVCNLDGSGATRETSSIESSSDPCWSSDGTVLVVARGGSQIKIVTDPTTETLVKNGLTDIERPSWYDSANILYQCVIAGTHMRILYCPTGGGTAVDLSSVEADISFECNFYTPKVSPSGAKIAFASDKGSASTAYEIWVMNLDGTNPIQLTHRTSTDASNDYTNYRPVWSPDSTRIVFYSGKPGDLDTYDIYGMNVDGSKVTNITNNSYPDINPSWR